MPSETLRRGALTATFWASGRNPRAADIPSSTRFNPDGPTNNNNRRLTRPGCRSLLEEDLTRRFAASGETSPICSRTGIEAHLQRAVDSLAPKARLRVGDYRAPRSYASRSDHRRNRGSSTLSQHYSLLACSAGTREAICGMLPIVPRLDLRQQLGKLPGQGPRPGAIPAGFNCEGLATLLGGALRSPPVASCSATPAPMSGRLAEHLGGSADHRHDHRLKSLGSLEIF